MSDETLRRQFLSTNELCTPTMIWQQIVEVRYKLPGYMWFQQLWGHRRVGNRPTRFQISWIRKCFLEYQCDVSWLDLPRCVLCFDDQQKGWRRNDASPLPLAFSGHWGRGRGSNYPEELESVFSDVSRHDWLKESELGTDGRCGKRWSRRSTGSSVVNTPATLSMEYGRWMSVARQSMTASYRPGYGSLSNDCNYSTEHLSVAGELSNEFKILQHAVY